MKPLLSQSLLCAIAIAGAMSSNHASVLVQEGFAYAVSGSSTMNGVAATGTGLQGNWTVTNTFATTGTSSSLFVTSGLTFGANYGTTTGGALRQTASFQGSNAQSVATAQLNASATGTLWGSYLVNYSAISTGGGGFSSEGISTTSTGTSVYFASVMQSDATAANRKLQVSYDLSQTASSANTAFLTNTTYIYISKYTNVGTVLSGVSTGVAQTWVMSQTQYDTWVDGGATEGTLTANSLVTRTDTATSGQFNFDSGSYVKLTTDAPNFNGLTVTAIYDELLYGTTLADVYKAVPEPSATALLFGAGMSVLLFRRKRLA